MIKRSKAPELQGAAQILKRIDRRDLYCLAGEAIVNKQMRHRVKAADIASWCHSATLKAEDLVVHTLRLDWGNGEEYPLDKMAFFEADKPDEVCTLHQNKNETSQYRPQ